MLPFVEVPCKTLAELPRNVGGNILALAAVNKKWSRLPGDVRDVVAQNMGRATPSAMAFKRAFEQSEHEIETEPFRTQVQQRGDYVWKNEYFWIINCETGKVYLFYNLHKIGRAQKRIRHE